MQQITNFSYGEGKRKMLLSQFGISDVYTPIQKSIENDNLEKGSLNTSHLVLKDVPTKGGKMTKRWVDPNSGNEHAPHGSKVKFEHEGKTKTGTVGRVSSSGKYLIKDDEGKEHRLSHSQFSKHDDNNSTKQPVKQTGKMNNSPHHKLARTKDSEILKRYLASGKTSEEYHKSAEDVLKERGELPEDHKSTFKGSTDSKQAQKVDDKLQQDNDEPIDKNVKSDAEIVERVKERFEDFADAVGAVVDGMKKSAIMYGSGGVGKTFTTKQELQRKFGKGRQFDPLHHTPGSDDYDYVFIDGGKVTPTTFYQLMYEHNGKVMCFDDCDSALENDDIKGYLKGALGSLQSQVSNMSTREVKASDGTKIPKQFNFDGKMIFITNIPKQKITSDKDMQPVMSRSFAQDMTMDRRSTMAYIKHIASDKKTGQLTNMQFDGIKNYTHEEMQHVVDMLEKHKDKMFDLNARTVETVLGFSKMAQARVEREDLNRQADGDPALTDKEKKELFDKHFNRKAIDYLYQHKAENGEIDENYIAKSNFNEFVGCSVDEAISYIKLGLN